MVHIIPEGKRSKNWNIEIYNFNDSQKRLTDMVVKASLSMLSKLKNKEISIKVYRNYPKQMKSLVKKFIQRKSFSHSDIMDDNSSVAMHSTNGDVADTNKDPQCFLVNWKTNTDNHNHDAIHPNICNKHYHNMQNIGYQNTKSRYNNKNSQSKLVHKMTKRFSAGGVSISSDEVLRANIVYICTANIQDEADRMGRDFNIHFIRTVCTASLIAAGCTRDEISTKRHSIMLALDIRTSY